jgi:hypothetical protein
MIQFPDGYCRVLTLQGKDVGLGFFCPKCRFQITAHAPDKIRHCGQDYKVGLLEKLPTVKLQYGNGAASLIEI